MGQNLLYFGYASSVLFLLIGLLGAFLSNRLIHSFVSSNVALVPSSESFKAWLSPPIDVHMNFYIFNLKNGDEFINNGSKPVFEEIGPFVFKEFIIKENITDNHNGTISYDQRKYYKFVKELSPYDLDYPITTINMAPVTIVNKIKYLPGAIRTVVDLALRATGDTLLITKTANETLFGYKDNFLDALSKLVKDLAPSPYVGFFYGKNDTSEGTYTIYTGENNYKNVGVIERFNYQNHSSVWSSDYANMINGTDGSTYPPFIDPKKNLYVFESDLCRSLYSKYTGTYKTLDNIELYSFSPDEYFFANETVNPDNADFCTPPGNCLGAGVLNITNCLNGIPLLMSCPHFLYADDRFTSDVIGLKPDPILHNTSLNIEPLTGFLMKANKRIQFNTKLIRDDRIQMFKNIPEIMYPLFWIDENFEIDQVNADKFYYKVKIPIAIFENGKFVIFGIGILLMISCSIISIFKWKQLNIPEQREEENLMPDENTPLI